MAETETIESRVKWLVQEQTGAEDAEIISSASLIDDLNCDSLDLVELLISAEDEFEVCIADKDAVKIVTVGDAVVAIQQRVKGNENG